MKKLTTTLIASLCLMGTAQAQDNSQNYVMKRTMLNDTGSSYISNIQYYDGLGRPFQSVEYAFKSYTQTGSILATLQEYDTMGRESDSWLPISISGSYLAPTTFKSNAPGNYGSDARPYSHKVYENSPLDRLTESYRPGSAWSTKPAKVEYAVNTTDSPLNCVRYSVSSADALVNNGNYAKGTLRVTKSTDEDDKVQYTFTDKQGQKLLERSVNGSEYLDTYYVYDDYGCLRFVLQPEYQTTADLSKYAFQYKYDSHNNCIWKKLPGAAYVTYEYDAADRMIFSQDGNQRAAGKWTFYVYDSLNRLTQQGENTNKAVAASGVYLQNYYDNYTSLRSAVNSNSNYPDDTSGNSRGFLTGTMTKVLGTDTKLYTAFYYDIEGKVTKKVQQNLLGGHDITTTTYCFSGKPLTVTHAHTATGKTARTEVYTYTYDEKDRVSTVKHKLGSAEVTLASYTYDTFGRMATKQLHGSAANKLTYSYNIQNWLTGISSTKFTQTLGYGSNYNGNISSMNWNANGASHSYTFTYDGVNRMLNATHGTGAYTEKVTSYDKNGNIKALQRYGNGLIDNLTYTYSGNQLTKVEDATGNSAGFSNGASATNEYVYDNNGNLTKDSNKNISSIAYNCLNLPSKVTFSDGSTITYSYAADGTKLRTVHTISGTTTTKDYCANVVYENGVQKLLLTEEGYVDLSATTPTYYYYLKDHQGNNRVVINSLGTVSETNHYYPFGGVFASTGNVQPFKYNGKELDTKKGLNWYDYGARHYDATLGRWFVVNPLAEKYYAWSPYAYCNNNPIGTVDFEGKLVIFINGMHIGDGGTIDYWNKNGGGFADGVMKHLKDNHVMFIDGSFGGVKRIPANLAPEARHYMGWLQGMANIDNIISAITNSQGELKETIKVITHSMGAAFAKGFIEALINGLLEHDIPLSAIEFEADFAPYQPFKQKAVKNVKHLQFTNIHDDVANNKHLDSPFAVIEGNSEIFIDDNANKGHSIKDFYNQIINLPIGNYKIVNGVIVPQN